MSEVQLGLFDARIRATRPLRAHRRADALLDRVRECLRRFPELDEHDITVGITRSADGIAVWEDFTVRFDVRRGLPTRYVVAHELTHLLQALRHVPQGEVQCDVWTLARHPSFRDEPPCYLPVPDVLVRSWGASANRVGELCRRAIEIRPRHRTYLRWLGARLEELAAEAPGSRPAPRPDA